MSSAPSGNTGRLTVRPRAVEGTVNHPPKLEMDKVAAKRILDTFMENAYNTGRLWKYQEALKSLYGKEWTVTINLQRRMQFLCGVCNKEMNSVNAVADHTRSGNHQKTKNTVQEESLKHVTNRLTPQSLLDRLKASCIKPIGVQFLMEFSDQSAGKQYYMCTLCGCHSHADQMVQHLIGTKHTDNYIIARCAVPSGGVHLQHREAYRNFILEEEGSGIDKITTIMGHENYPYHLEKDSHYSTRGCSSTESPSPVISSAATTNSGVRAFAKDLHDVSSPLPMPPLLVGEKSAGRKSPVQVTDADAETRKSTCQKVTLETSGGIREVKNEVEAVRRIHLFLQRGHTLYCRMSEEVDSSSSAEEKELKERNVQNLSRALGVIQKKIIPKLKIKE